MQFLNAKERKLFFKRLEEQYGYSGPTDYVIYISGQEKYFVISRDIEKVPFEHLRVRFAGVYAACEMKNGIRLTLDGAQLFAPHCTKIIDVEEHTRDSWMKGEDVPAEGEGFFIVRSGKDIIGCGPASHGILRNFVPKERRIMDPHTSVA